MKNLHCFCIDLDSRKPKVLLFSGDALHYDLKFFNALTPKELETPDRRIFNTLDQAQKFLERYNSILKNLNNKDICSDQNAVCMRSKRRHIVLSILSGKCSTVRKFKRNWAPGSLFNLEDQTFFLTVKLISIVEIKKGKFQYNYTLIK